MRLRALAYGLILLPGAVFARQSVVEMGATESICPVELAFFAPPERMLDTPPFASGFYLPARPDRLPGEARAEAPAWVYAADPADSTTIEVTLERLYGDGETLDGRYSRVASGRLDAPGSVTAGLNGGADFRFEPGDPETEDCFDVIEDCSRFDAANVYYHIDRMATEFWRDRMGFDPPFQADVVTHIAGDGAFADPPRNLIKLSVGWIFMLNAAKEDEIIYHEYTHLVAAALGFLVTIDTPVYAQALSEGYADYFAATFTGDPRIGEWVVTCPDRRECAGPPDDQELRTLVNDRSEWSWRGGSPSSTLKYGVCTRFHTQDLKCKTSWNNFTPRYTWAIIWGSLLWDLREVLGADVMDRIALEAISGTEPDTETFERAAGRLVEADQLLFGGVHRAAIVDAAEARGIIVATSTDPGVAEVPFRIAAHPMPGFGRMALDLEMDRSDQVTVRAFDAAGRQVEQLFSGFGAFGRNRIDWDVSRLPAGVYFVRVDAGSGLSSVVPIVVAR